MPPRHKANASDAPERVVDITFPVAGKVYFSDSFSAPRSGGRVHQASDLMGTKLQKVHAAMSGTVSFITGVDSPVPSYGYMLTIDGDDGLRYSYIHMNNDRPGTDDGEGGVAWAYAPDVRRGERVRRGQWLGYMGDSGNAESTGAHLHFEIHDATVTNPYGEDRLNPHASLLAALQRGDVPVAKPPADTPAEPLPVTPVVSPPPLLRPAPTPDPGQVPDDGRVERLSGGDRVHTAVALSRESHTSASTVVIAPQASHAEALVAAPLAAHVGAPVLLSQSGGLGDAVAAEVRRLGARNAYLIGTEEQLSPQVAADLRAAGIQAVGRIAAPDRYELSARVARDLQSYTPGERFSSVLIALGDSPQQDRAWPDALSATALAAHLRVPILFVSPETLPGVVHELLAELRPDTITVIGGSAAISDVVAGRAAAAAGGARVERLGGATRYETSIAVAEAGRDAGLTTNAVWVATGRNFPDALAAGPAAAASGSPLVLIDGANVGGTPSIERWLDDEGFERATVVGGTAAVSEPVAEQLQRLLAG